MDRPSNNTIYPTEVGHDSMAIGVEETDLANEDQTTSLQQP